MKKLVISLCLLLGISLVVANYANALNRLPGTRVSNISSIKAGHTEACVNAGTGQCEVTGSVTTCSASTVGNSCGKNYGFYQRKCVTVNPEEEGAHCTPLPGYPCTTYLICTETKGWLWNTYACDGATPIEGWTWNTCYEH